MIDICKDLEFYEANHLYKIDGCVIPSVSQIIAPLSDRTYKNIDKKTLQHAADKGTEVHFAIENWIKFGIEDIRGDYKKYFDGFIEWWNLNTPEVLGSEIKFYHKVLRYGGTADLICKIDGEVTLVDYKTSSNINELNYGIQLEAYARALESQEVKIERKEILHLKKDGKWKAYDFQVNDNKKWRYFNALYTLKDLL